MRQVAKRTSEDRRLPHPAVVLFVSMFAAQAGFLVLSPILPEMSREFGISTAAGGQLRLALGIAGGLSALALAPLARRLDLRNLLTAGLGLLGVGSFGSALAPSFVVLAVAQLAIGAGLGIVVSAAIAAAAEWSPPEQRGRTLSWTLVGQPAAWVVGMPVVGAVAGIDWRLAWLSVPFAASLIALAAVRRRPSGAPAAKLGVSWRRVWGRPGWRAGHWVSSSPSPLGAEHSSLPERSFSSRMALRRRPSG